MSYHPTPLPSHDSMSFVVQMGLNENEKHIPKNSWRSVKKTSVNYSRYSKKLSTTKLKTKHGTVTKPKGERKNSRKNNRSLPTSSGMALYNPASYFMCSNTPSDVSLLKHKAKLVGTSPSERKQDKSDESLVAQYHCPKFDKLIDPIVRNSRLDHSYFKGASDPILSPIGSLNGLGNKYQHGNWSTPNPPTVHKPLLPILNQLPNTKSVFGIARAGSPPKSLPQSASYLVPQHPLVLPMSPHLSPHSVLGSKYQGRHSESSCDEEREPDPQGEDTETAPENGEEEDEYSAKLSRETSKPLSESGVTSGSVAVDDSVTRCVCGFLHDDGYMICCDTCFVWQHVDCMEIDRKNIPDEYLCEECKPRRVDKMKAIGIQIQKIKRLTDKTVRNNNDDDANSESSHSSQERTRPRGSGGKRKVTFNKSKTRAKRGQGAATVSAATTGQRRRKTSTASSSLSPGSVQVTPAVGKGKKSAPVASSSPPNLNNILHSNNKRKMITVAEKKQNSAKSNASGKVLFPLNHHKTSPSERISEKPNVVKRMGKKQQEKKLFNNNNNHKRKNNSLLVSSDTRPVGTSPALETPEKKEPPPVQSSDEEESKPMTRWIDNYEEATCNYYAPDLRACIATMKMNGNHQDVKLPSNLMASTVQKCRASLLSSGTKILVTSTNMGTNQALIEMRGKYLLARGDRKSVPAPGQHVFFYTMQHEGIDIIIDCKTYGNDARFLRRSCKPNAMMKHCIDKGSIHIYLTSLYSVTKNTEVTVSYSSGGNPDLCTCGDKATCTAVEQKSSMYSERKHQSSAKETSEAEPPASDVKVKESSPSPTPTPPLPPTSIEEKKEVNTEVEAIDPPSDTTTTQPVEIIKPAKKEKENKIPTNIATEKGKKQSEEKRKPALDTDTSSSQSATEKEPESVKKSTVISPVPASTAQKRKKSIQKRKYSESSQSLESDVNTEEDEEDTTSKVNTRRSSSTSKSTPGKKETATTPTSTPTKLSREERKLEAIMKAFERMEKSATRQKESRVRKDSSTNEKWDDGEKLAPTVKQKPQQPRVQTGRINKIIRKRKGRSKSFSISSSSARSRRAIVRGKSVQKDEESTSGEEDEDLESSSDNSLQSSNVETPPPNFKLPFSKKEREDSNQDPESPDKPAGGCAKKRWLRQAISEECESPRSDSPTPLGESAGPLKKRRLARASLSIDDKNFTPPTTPVPDEEPTTPPHDTLTTLTPKTAYASLVTPPFATPEPTKTSIQFEKTIEPSEKCTLTTSSPSSEVQDTSLPLLESPQALESSLQNSCDFNMPSASILSPSPLSSSFYMSPWAPSPDPGLLPPPVLHPPPPPPPPSQELSKPQPPSFKEKQVTKRKLSISEYRQRKGTSLSAGASLFPLASPTPPEEEPPHVKAGAGSPPTSSSDEEREEVCGGSTRVIEKSVLVDNLIAKISKSADSLAESQDTMFTRIPISPSVMNKKPKAPLFLERPKENLLDRLNREFNIRLSEGKPLNAPKPIPPIPPGVMVPPPTVEYEDLTSDLYIPIASRSHGPPRSVAHKK